MIAIAMAHLRFFLCFFTCKIGNLACVVSVELKTTLIMASALIAHPLALSIGAKLRLRSLNHASTMDGPEMTKRIATMAANNLYHSKALIPFAKSTKTDPMAPNAMLIAAKIPANLAISKLSFLAASAGAVCCCTVVVMLSKAFLSFSSADLLIRSVTHCPNLR